MNFKLRAAAMWSLTVLILAGAGALSVVAHGTPAADPEPKCKISPLQAMKAATTKVPGRALNANFELDEGKWIYGVIVVSGKKLSEVQVDPMTGKAGAVEAVTPSDEAQEVKSELEKAIGIKQAAGKSAREKAEKDEKEDDEKPAKVKAPSKPKRP